MWHLLEAFSWGTALIREKTVLQKKKTGGRGREYGIFRNQEKEKIMYNFRVSAFRSYLTFLRSVKQLGGVASGEAFLCLELPGIKAKNLQIQRGFQKICPQISLSCFFSGIAHYIPYVKIFLLVRSVFIIQWDHITGYVSRDTSPIISRDISPTGHYFSVCNFIWLLCFWLRHRRSGSANVTVLLHCQMFNNIAR